MSRFRFSLAGLMAAVALVAFGCAALRYASDLWASTAFTLAVSVLFVGILRMLFRREQARVFCVGFMLFGWGYLALVFGLGVCFGWGIRPPHLLSTSLLTYLHSKVQQPVQAVTGPVVAGRGVAFADMDGDGSLDLYVTNPAGNSLYRSAGNGTFVDITQSASKIKQPRSVSDFLHGTRRFGDDPHDGIHPHESVWVAQRGRILMARSCTTCHRFEQSDLMSTAATGAMP